MTTLFTTGIWYGGVALEAVLLIRGLLTNLVKKFPLFYSYIFLVFAAEVSRFVAYQWASDAYANIYWATQFVALVFGCAVMFEIYQRGLAAFRGTARMARNILFLVFALLLAKSIAIASPGGVWGWVTQTPFEMERDLRIIQALALLALVGLFLTYSIPVDRNLKGILLGYGLFVASSVVQLTLASHFPSGMQTVWSYAQPLTYLIVLGVWAAALWSYQPSKTMMPNAEPVLDYGALTVRTRDQFEKASGELAKAVRS